MTDNDRIAALQAMAEGKPVEFAETSSMSGKRGFTITIRDYDTAATLLGALDLEAMSVDITPQCLSCDLHDYPQASQVGGGECILGLHEWVDPSVRMDDLRPIPGPNCPGPAKPGKKWILVEVNE